MLEGGTNSNLVRFVQSSVAETNVSLRMTTAISTSKKKHNKRKWAQKRLEREQTARKAGRQAGETNRTLLLSGACRLFFSSSSCFIITSIGAPLTIHTAFIYSYLVAPICGNNRQKRAPLPEVHQKPQPLLRYVLIPFD